MIQDDATAGETPMTPVTPNPDPQSGASSAAFVTTHWTQVLSARGDSPEAQAALSELCGAYYAPVRAFIQRAAPDDEAARDLTQEFFARILARQGLDTVVPGKGRFRSFLLGAVKHFLADMRDHARADKRGRGETPLPLDADTDTPADTHATDGLQIADANAAEPDREFDRKWALTILDRALAALAREHSEAGKSSHFEMLKPWLTGDAEHLSQAGAARALSMNEGAVKVAVHRLRRRFRELVKAEIAQTVPDPVQVEQELRHLLEALNRT